MLKPFPEAPTNIWYFIIIIAIAGSTLYLDYMAGRTSNAIIFFTTTVVVPLIVVAIANRIEGTKFVEFLGFLGSPLFALSMILLSGGITGIVFFSFIRPASMLVTGTNLYKSITVIFLPLSSKPFWFLAFSPAFSLVFYSAVAVGEEIIKCIGYKITANALYKYIPSKGLVYLLGFVISIAGWVSLHAFSWGSIDIFGFSFGLVLSYIFLAPYLIFGESLISPEYGVEMSKFSIYAPIGGHLFYNFFLTMQVERAVFLTMSQGLVISGALAGFGLLLLAILYIKRDLPIFGYIRI